MKSKIVDTSKMTLLLVIILGVGLTSIPYGEKAWAGDNNDDDDDDNDKQWSENEWDKDSLDGVNEIIYGQGLIFGTNHEDFIVGSDFDDVIFAKHGNDEIQSGLLNDRVYGDGGDDTVQGGLGNDQLFGEGGNDNLIGNIDDDYILGGDGDDHLWGGFGDDALRGGKGADFFDCGDNVDEIKDFSIEQGDIRLANCEIVNTKN